MKKLIELFGGKAAETIGNVVDSVTTSTDEKLRAKKEIGEVIFNALSNLANAQRDVLVAEMTGSKLQRSWRPIVMLLFAFIIIFHYAVYPIMLTFKPGLPMLPDLKTEFWSLLKIGLGGYVIGRSVEKTAKTFSKGVDLPMFRRRDRKNSQEE